MSQLIHFTNGGFYQVDAVDYDFLNQFDNWRRKLSDGSDKKFHAVRDVEIGGCKLTIRAARLIVEARADQIVTHLNGDTLDNRRKNLHIRTVNPWTGRPTEAGFRGVHQLRTSRWAAGIEFAGNKYNLGTNFHSPHEAAVAYDVAARKLYGANAVTNF